MNSDFRAPSPGFGGTLSGDPIVLGHPRIQPRDKYLRLGASQAVEQCIDQEGSRLSPHDCESFEFCDAMFSSK